MPVFEFVKEQKSSEGILTEKMKYQKWRKNYLDLSLQKGTSILNIKYKETNKKNIIPVLNNISKIYQDYSTNQNKINLTKTISNLKDQIKKFDAESQESLQRLQNYSQEYNLLFPKFLNLNQESLSPNFLENSNQLNNFLFLTTPEEQLRMDINETIEKINLINSDKDNSRLIIIASKLSDNEFLAENIESLKKIENEITKKV